MRGLLFYIYVRGKRYVYYTTRRLFVTRRYTCVIIWNIRQIVPPTKIYEYNALEFRVFFFFLSINVVCPYGFFFILPSDLRSRSIRVRINYK